MPGRFYSPSHYSINAPASKEAYAAAENPVRDALMADIQQARNDLEKLDPLSDLREAVEFLDKCRASGDSARMTGALTDAVKWVETEYRALLGIK